MKPLFFTRNLVIIFSFFNLFRKRSKQLETKEEPINPYNELRNLIFNIKSEELNVEFLEGNLPYGTLMELGYPQATVSLISLIDGNTSLYFSTGGGILGGVAHESVRKSSIEFVNRSNDFLNIMNITTSYPSPETGMVIFYVITSNGVFSYNESEETLQNNKSRLTDLYILGQNVISQLRITTEGK
jgi:hypothetical protein